ncbi:uncharacterized protein LOC112536142 isoform X1 [Ricinus communis]|uniref:uncharacterized protein LOC112536142 isoform X1 n=1 Tax=Ricinus communis TaxID=3988 RepID=UPI00201ACD39|nr:uncharacterized protein LOC112536142 isoform X1 [Ricinus communis]
MESTKSSSQYQLPSPMIIAMKGPSNNKKLEIASSLAQFLHYPLIDEEDVTLDLKNSLTGFPKELPFKIVTQITKTQLQVKLQVIINTSLSQDTHIDHWLELARSKGAHLLIVECTNEGSQGSEHGVGYAPVLRIDISKPFTVEEFVPTIMNAVEFHEKANHEGKSQPEVSKEITQVHETIPQRIFMEAHAHEFSFTTEPKMDSTKLRCNYCEDFISGPTYQCIECDGFILHKSCAETQKIQVIPELFYLTSCPSVYSFPREDKCRLCDHYSSNCNHCLLQTHIKCRFLPTICQYEKHTHTRLTLSSCHFGITTSINALPVANLESLSAINVTVAKWIFMLLVQYQCCLRLM